MIGKVLNDSGVPSFFSLSGLDIAARILDEMIACLKAVNIPVIATHRESAPSQFEIVLDYCEIFEAVDRVVLAREVVRSIARRYGLRASFIPKINDLMGNGGHVHISLDGHFGTSDVWKGERIGVDKVGRSFMAGLLNGLPWVSCLVNSSPVSYKRILPGARVGAYQIWGYNNKEAPIRLMADSSNIEVKFGDAISNPYIAMAAILSAGALGVTKELELPDACQVYPYVMEESERPPLLPSRRRNLRRLSRRISWRKCSRMK